MEWATCELTLVDLSCATHTASETLFSFSGDFPPLSTFRRPCLETPLPWHATCSTHGKTNGEQAMLKITRCESADHTKVTLQLAGQVIGPWVQALQQSCDQEMGTGSALELDLREVSFIDRAGLALCRTLKNQQITIRHCSPFVAEQLKSL